ncbi:pentapeptide repeat-containing protein [Nonomuraea bangladeshensis]|uniref:pentapeptide repeat-containing protein n=1 Tax=Nonomuraea bangladeshensis TaxID=404385 RepID=UPI003C2EF9E9
MTLWTSSACPAHAVHPACRAGATRKIRAAQRAARTRAARSDAAPGRNPHEERQVRLTAQRILTDHLPYQDPSARRWWQPRRADPNPRYCDLTGAASATPDSAGRRSPGGASFGGATFTGDVGFDQATFTRCATFAGATGLERAELDGARVALAEKRAKRVWPSCRQVVDEADGWQTLVPGGGCRRWRSGVPGRAIRPAPCARGGSRRSARGPSPLRSGRAPPECSPSSGGRPSMARIGRTVIVGRRSGSSMASGCGPAWVRVVCCRFTLPGRTPHQTFTSPAILDGDARDGLPTHAPL